MDLILVTKMNEPDTKTQIREFIFETFPLARKNRLGDSESLVNSGIVDSMGILEIVTFLEDDLKITLTDEEMLADNFSSIEQIADFVDSRSKATTD